MSHVLIVDDEPSICWGFREFLSDEGHQVSVAASAEEALQLLEQQTPDAVVLDIRLPGMDGLTAIRRFREHLGDVPIIVITAFGNLETAVRAVEEGAFEYLPKPFDLDQAADLVGRALAMRRATVQTSAAADAGSEWLVGSSPAMQQVFKQIALVAAADVPVLITGESGTGKELVARAIHQHSRRRENAYLPICLPALSAGVLESELFGHVKGAFTGATSDRQGLFELADGGTVMLDEIADVPPSLQVKLLRALEQREITPVGAARPRETNVRILAATNRNLSEMIAAGAFREDLYFRLSVFQIALPPLRDRREDIPQLAQHFLKQVQPAAALNLSEEMLDALSRRDWPGNVRELRNAIEHAAVMSRGQPLRPEHLPPALTVHQPAPGIEGELPRLLAAWADVQADAVQDGDADSGLYERFLALAEPPLLRAILRRCQNNKAAAAQMLGMHRATLRQKLKRYGIE